ncbi:transmembrane and coiled-coil domain-containing protein 4-like [Xenia sp. Carnegie-2017]|uniref:transmembrane and coiled-coil domain-containing protein 4-like n=1 Tax=Xenia sp. Carnegie-2017 TaxID=2897299 RepID=UPI001F049AAB|nr:transmembrane and coiled-coil domain-containing protein 4-like [Xenia sp. Carnegie-2017]XP_046854374.1 transmembrane and coiled-coil domain-containing protein 4-like [Xenia sp. Carnegie-2017]XP_046854375.1 transmembrane and coiled-coil domain-containing protein 4-like [Xenia sp. Carnegie-2017]
MASKQPEIEELKLHVTLSDVGKYSLAQLCVYILCDINESLFDIKWSEDFIIKLVLDMNLPNSVSTSLSLMLKEAKGCESDQNVEMLINALKNEESLCGDVSILCQELIRLSVKQGCYDARARILIFIVSRKFGMNEDCFLSYEDELADSLNNIMNGNDEVHEEADKRKSYRKKKKAFMIGLGVVAGGAIIGLTGGLAAPVVAASAGAIIGGSGAAFLASSAGLAFITSIFGATGAGLTGYKMNRRVGMTEEFEFLTLSNSRCRLYLTICISGWLTQSGTDEFLTQWSTLSTSVEAYSLVWESKFLLELGSAIQDFITSYVVGTATTEALKYTVLQGIMAAIAWPVTLLNAAKLIDNPWGVCASRAKEVGKELAKVLISREQGRRPVSLVGFSLGARVIFYCLEEMQAYDNSCGIIQDVIVLGAPVTGRAEKWQQFSNTVAGTIFNGYCQKDWLLRFIYRASSLQVSIAGLHEITWESKKLVNVDLTEIINSHMDYADPEKLRIIFEMIGLKTNTDELIDKN